MVGAPYRHISVLLGKMNFSTIGSLSPGRIPKKVKGDTNIYNEVADVYYYLKSDDSKISYQ